MARGPEFKARIQDHVERYLKSDGADGGTNPTGTKVLLLTTTGRKTGKQVTVPLAYFEEGDRLVVVASNGGLETHPHWYNNLASHPNVRLKVFADEYDAVAKTATAAERRRLWPKIVAAAPGYNDYQAGNSREIPLVLLRRSE